MEAYQLYLTDEQHLLRIAVIIAITQIDKASHFLQLFLTIGRHANLSCTGNRDMIGCLDDTITLIFTYDAYRQILRATLPDVFRHKLEHERVASLECRIHLHRKVITVHGGSRNEKQVGLLVPDISSIASGAVLRVAVNLAYGHT